MNISVARLTRRAALCRCARAATFTAVASNLRPLFAASKSRWFKIGACDWSLGKGADLAAFDVARQIGLDGVQVSLGSTKDDMHLHTAKVQKAYRVLSRHVIDTTTLAWEHLVPCGLDRLNLDAICEFLGIELDRSERHGALADVQACRAAYLMMLRATEEQRIAWRERDKDLTTQQG